MGQWKRAFECTVNWSKMMWSIESRSQITRGSKWIIYLIFAAQLTTLIQALLSFSQQVTHQKINQPPWVIPDQSFHVLPACLPSACTPLWLLESFATVVHLSRLRPCSASAKGLTGLRWDAHFLPYIITEYYVRWAFSVAPQDVQVQHLKSYFSVFLEKHHLPVQLKVQN